MTAWRSRLRSGMPLVLSALVLSAVGCGERGSVPVAVQGTVSYRGKPLSAGMVRFVPADAAKGRLATATIQANGRYSMSTFTPGDGVLPGEYTVTVSATDTSGVSAKEIEKGYATKSAIPTRYLDPAQSGLKEKIEGPRNISIDLTDE